MSFAVRQVAQGFTGVATTITVGFASPVLEHSLLVVFAYVNLSAAPSAVISDTLGNSWTSYRPSWDNAAAFWYAENSLAGTDSVTVSTASTNLLQLQIAEVTGFTNGPTVVTSGHASSSSSSPSCTTSGSASVGDIALGFLWTTGGTPFTAGTGFTLDQQQSGSFGFNTATEHQDLSSAGAVTVTFGIGASVSWGCYGVVFNDGGTPRFTAYGFVT